MQINNNIDPSYDADGNTWQYDYDGMGQLTLAQKFTSASTLLDTHAFSYDQIGNRTNAIENNTATDYVSNIVNQYTQIAAQIPVYDADGNMTSYNGWTYSYNGENRLIEAEKGGTRLEFAYDYMGRRIYKKVYTDNSLTLHRKFVYDGYKLISEFDALDSDTQIASYLWQPVGMDVPLMRNNKYYTTDGNKNVIELRSATGAVTTSYAYNPFGEIESPTVGDDNPFRFSSEYHDDEIGLVYYNYRYYSPSLGRWINRDPIEEQGGVNLYGFLTNAPVSFNDYAGLHLYAVDGTWTKWEKNRLDKSVVQRFYENCIEQKYYWQGPELAATGLDASGIYRGVKETICNDYCKNNRIKINLVGWSRGATIVMEVAEELEDDGCCCKGKKKYPRINWMGLFDAVDMTLTWGWANNITSNVDNASHMRKTESQLIFPTSNGKAENPKKTNLTNMYLLNSDHSDVGGNLRKNNARLNSVSLNWMIHEAQRNGVKMKGAIKNYVVAPSKSK